MSGMPKAVGARFTLYGSSPSPYVRELRVMMAEKSISYELVQVNVFQPPAWFAEISPLGKIPVLHDSEAPGDGMLADSAVIAAYLERSHPGIRLIPADPWEAV